MNLIQRHSTIYFKIGKDASETVFEINSTNLDERLPMEILVEHRRGIVMGYLLITSFTMDTVAGNYAESERIQSRVSS